MHATVVTCYYPTRCRRPSQTYMDWAREFMKISAPVVLFTTKELAVIFESYRSDRPIRIISRPLEELITWTRYEREWRTAHGRDPEKRIHSVELFAVWACKPFFVCEAIEINPYASKKFLWCDIGAFREPMPPYIRNNFPLASRLPDDDRLLIQAINPITSGDMQVRADGIPGDFLKLDRIVGGFWGGTAQACRRWLAAYEDMLIRYCSSGRFSGKEQSVMASALLANPDIAHVLTCNSPGDPWFHFTRLLSDKSIPFVHDLSYQAQHAKPIVSPIFDGAQES
jgi:hypothetical protein